MQRLRKSEKEFKMSHFFFSFTIFSILIMEAVVWLPEFVNYYKEELNMFKKKKWYQKRVSKWTGKDLLQGTLITTLLTTVLASIPIVGYCIKEEL